MCVGGDCDCVCGTTNCLNRASERITLLRRHKAKSGGANNNATGLLNCVWWRWWEDNGTCKAQREREREGVKKNRERERVK